MGKHSGSGSGNSDQRGGKHSTTSDHRHVNQADNDAVRAAEINRLAQQAEDVARRDLQQRMARGE